MKGILLAGAHGTRLYPLTHNLSKQILPVYDKPMIYYPLSTLMLAGIRDIVIISTPRDIDMFFELLGDGQQWGINFSYLIQQNPEGIPQAFIIAKNFLGNDNCSLVLGDNIFYGRHISAQSREAAHKKHGATVFAYRVNDPQRYGVVEFDRGGKVVCIEEKPIAPKSNYVLTGLYFYDNQVIDIAKTLVPSARGELEITDINKVYLAQGSLEVALMDRGVTWLDTGTPESLLDAASFIQTMEKRQGLKISCPEEVAYRMGFINVNQLEKLANSVPDGAYRQYLLNILKFDKLYPEPLSKQEHSDLLFT
jgi:glucose-1-phosphate thymidylyltransferase